MQRELRKRVEIYSGFTIVCSPGRRLEQLAEPGFRPGRFKRKLDSAGIDSDSDNCSILPGAPRFCEALAAA